MLFVEPAGLLLVAANAVLLLSCCCTFHSAHSLTQTLTLIAVSPITTCFVCSPPSYLLSTAFFDITSDTLTAV